MHVQRLYSIYSKDDVRSPFVKPPWSIREWPSCRFNATSIGAGTAKENAK
jgi:hypothetical protein